MQNNKFMLIPIPEDGSCSVAVVWEALIRKLIPGTEELFKKYPSMDDFVKAAAQKRLEFEEIINGQPNDQANIFQQIALLGTSALKETWKEMEGSLLDASLSIVGCQAKIFDIVIKNNKLEQTITNLGSSSNEDPLLSVIRYNCPNEHFGLLITENSTSINKVNLL